MPIIWSLYRHPSAKTELLTEVYRPVERRPVRKGVEIIAASHPPNIPAAWEAYGQYKIEASEVVDSLPEGAIVVGPRRQRDAWRKYKLSPKKKTRDAVVLRLENDRREAEEDGSRRPVLLALAPKDGAGALPTMHGEAWDPDSIVRQKMSPRDIRKTFALAQTVPNYKVWTEGTVWQSSTLRWAVERAWRMYPGRSVIVIGREISFAFAHFLHSLFAANVPIGRPGDPSDPGYKMGHWYHTHHFAEAPDRVCLLPDLSDPWWICEANARIARQRVAEAGEEFRDRRRWRRSSLNWSLSPLPTQHREGYWLKSRAE